MGEVKDRFDPRMHPDVQKGVKTIEEVRFEFFNLFTTLHSTNNNFDAEAKVNFNDFKEWHTIVNTQIERDADFSKLVNGVWQLDAKENQPSHAGGIQRVEIAREADRDARQMYKHDFHRKTFGNEQILQHNLPADYVETEVQPKIITNPALRNRVPPIKAPGQKETALEICQRVSNKIVARGAAGIGGMSRSFRIMDKDRNGSLSFQEVKQAMYSYHICDTDKEIQAIFEVFDTDRSGSICFNEFIRAIVGEMNQRRKNVAIAAFRKMDCNANGVLEMDDIKRLYNAKNHPDVVQGKRSEDQVLCEFLDTFEFHYVERYGNKSKDRKIDLSEWLEYYNHVSANIDNDEFFEIMMKNAYDL